MLTSTPAAAAWAGPRLRRSSLNCKQQSGVVAPHLGPAHAPSRRRRSEHVVLALGLGRQHEGVVDLDGPLLEARDLDRLEGGADAEVGVALVEGRHDLELVL